MLGEGGIISAKRPLIFAGAKPTRHTRLTKAPVWHTPSNAAHSQQGALVTTNPGQGGRVALRIIAIEGSTVLAALIILVVVSAIFAPGFMTSENLTNVLVQSVFVIILGIGMTFVLVAGGIDLSVGSTMGLSGALCIYSMNSGV